MSKPNVVPTRMNLMLAKAQLGGAKKGHELLKKKADALKKAFRETMIKIIDVKKRMGREFNEAMLALAEANFAAGDFGRNVVDQVKSKSNIRLSVATDNIAGVYLPKYAITNGDREESDDKAMLGLTGGGKAIAKCREKFSNFLKLLILIASYQTQFITLNEVIKVTNRRVNALEYVIVPRIQNLISHIDLELGELEREEFFRLKKVTDKKKKKKLIDDQVRLLAAGGHSEETAAESEQDQNAIFQEEGDEDVVF